MGRGAGIGAGNVFPNDSHSGIVFIMTVSLILVMYINSICVYSSYQKYSG